MHVLIVDDEPLIREGLAGSVNWELLGFSVVSSAADGMEALASVELSPPDLILTDVRMPYLDGLELSARVREILPDVCIVIISGHEEFAYARAAMKLNVFDYILKPIKLDELTEVVRRAAGHIRTQRERREDDYYAEIFKGPVNGRGPALFLDKAVAEAPDAMELCDIREFSRALASGGSDETLSRYQEIQERFLKMDSCPRILLQLTCSNLFFECKHAVEEQDGQLEAIFDSPVEVFRSVMTQPTMQEMFQALTPILSAMLSHRDSLHGNHFSREVDMAKKYIQDHFNEVDLSLNSVARHVNMSACYFSVVFKKETGVTFINYLTQVRIEKARELLRSSKLKSYEISYQVGYNNPTYFSTVFKKLTGVSPVDYKKQGGAS
ncbi:MAG: response regulator [Bacillota bacterium]|nr:response regulator [Bacillota bacterium]